MNYQVFSENEWVYPDSSAAEGGAAELHSARGATVCFQLLTDHVLKGGETITAAFSLEGCEAVVYPMGDRVWNGVRAHLQRAGAEDYELLALLRRRDPSKAAALIEQVCRTFDDYEFSPAILDQTRRELLEALGG